MINVFFFFFLSQAFNKGIFHDISCAEIYADDLGSAPQLFSVCRFHCLTWVQPFPMGI